MNGIAQMAEILGSTAKKIITGEEAAKIADNFRAQGLKIGFTNGTFDLCHLGHLASFLTAKSLCDKLFVGVNSDASVKRYKGFERPIHDEYTRAFILVAMECIDYVIVFDDDTALPLVKKIKPDMLAKEGYALDKWPEGKWVEENCGRAVTLDRLENYSTTNLIAKIKRSA
jgi:D-beta-D-heptose 7-phosphate kinase/D-beta-D-heptose 1-phosphate adenosyltransferase